MACIMSQPSRISHATFEPKTQLPGKRSKLIQPFELNQACSMLFDDAMATAWSVVTRSAIWVCE